MDFTPSLGNVNLSVIYRIWLTKCTFFGLVIRIRSSLFIIRRIRSPSPGLPGSACHPASPYSCPCRRTVGPAGSAGCLVRPGPGPRFVYGPCEECGPNLGPDSEAETGSRMRRRIRASSSEKKPQTQKGPAALWQRVLLNISPIAWTSLKQFVIRIMILVNQDSWDPVIRN